MNYLDFFEATILNNGATLCNNGINCNNGYFVSLPTFEKKIALNEFSVIDVECYIQANLGAFNEGLVIGSWVNNDVVYLDVSEQIFDKRLAIETAYKNNQLALYDATNNAIISLLEPQKSGTATQQRAYLTQVIDKLCQSI